MLANHFARLERLLVKIFSEPTHFLCYEYTSIQEPIMEDNTPILQPPAEPREIARIDSATLARLIEEVRNENVEIGRNYDRVHNRHNR
jgi:hypothetical protein